MEILIPSVLTSMFLDDLLICDSRMGELDSFLFLNLNISNLLFTGHLEKQEISFLDVFIGSIREPSHHMFVQEGTAFCWLSLATPNM